MPRRPRSAEPATPLECYLRETGTTQAWLAGRVGTTSAKVCRWATGASGMSEYDRRKVLAVLRDRAAIDLEGLLDDQPRLREPGSRVARERLRPGRPESPFERLLANRRTGIVERPLNEVLADVAGERP